MRTYKCRESSERLAVVALLAGLALDGCVSAGSRSRQLSRVAKDWALTIRASQIIPVYPLMEDLQPGDVYLVTSDINNQVKVFKSKGFLPMDQHVTRLSPGGYQSFYAGWYEPKELAGIPYIWRSAGSPAGTWANAPLAAFPSYTFSIKRGGGINVAVPIHGVSVGMSLLGASSATGSVTISEAHTYGIDDYSIRGKLMDWSAVHARYLANFEPTEGSQRYLRVVTRVFLTGQVDISLTSNEALGAKAEGGAPRAVDMLQFEGSGAPAHYDETVKVLQNSVDSALPGGTLKLTAASSRSVSMKENFPRPLVIGYLGFDVPILKGGALGVPLSTSAVLNQTASPESRVFQYDNSSQRARCIRAWIGETDTEDPNPHRVRLNEWLKRRNAGITATTWLSSLSTPGREEEYGAFSKEVGIDCP